MTNNDDKPSDRTRPEPRDLNVENALLRGALYLVTASLKRYCDASHGKLEPDRDGTQLFNVVVSEETRAKAADAISRGEKLLRDRQEGPCPS